MKYEHIIAEVLRYPWALLDSKFDAIVSVLALRESGERLSAEDVQAIVASGRKRAPQFYALAEDGERVAFEYDANSKSYGLSNRSGNTDRKLVAVVPIYGIILPRAANFDMSETGTGIDVASRQFRAALDNPNVTSILLDIDSPGGAVYGVDEFASEIFAARDQKKIVAQVSPLAASAAYWLASQAKEIAITPSGEAGSIGVRAMHQDLSKALEIRGVKLTAVFAGKYKTEGSPYEPLGEDAKAFMQQRVNEYYDSFAKAVARGRDVKASEVRNGFGEGRVLGAGQAKSEGMVDRIATFDETLQRLGVSTDGNRVVIAASAFAGAGGGADPGKSSSSSSDASMSTPASAEQEVPMGTIATPAAAAAGAEFTAERERVASIMRLATAHAIPAAKVEGWLTSTKSLTDVQGEIITMLKPTVISQPSAEERAEASRVEVMRDGADKVPDSQIFGSICRAFAAAKGDRREAAVVARHVFRNERAARMFEAAVDPQRAGDFASGGFLLEENISSAVIELLRPKSVVRAANPTLAPLVNGSLTIPKINSGATATYFGETKPIPPSKVKGGQIKASAKRLGVIVVISNMLLRAPSANADIIVRNDAVRAMAQKEDLSFLRNPGTEWGPKGLYYWANANNVFIANATVNVANVIADIHKAMETLEEANVDLTNLAWFFAPRTKHYLMQLRDNNGGFLYKDEMLRGTLEGIRYFVTPQIPKNLGAGNSSEIYLVAMSDVIIADAPQIAIEMSSEAAIDDGAGNLTSLFSTDMSAIRLIAEHDLIVRHTESVVRIDTVNWF